MSSRHTTTRRSSPRWVWCGACSSTLRPNFVRWWRTTSDWLLGSTAPSTQPIRRWAHSGWNSTTPIVNSARSRPITTVSLHFIFYNLEYLADIKCNTVMFQLKASLLICSSLYADIKMIVKNCNYGSMNTLLVQWNPSHEVTPLAPDKWPL